MDYRDNKDRHRPGRDQYNKGYRRDRYNNGSNSRDNNRGDRYEGQRPDNRKRPSQYERDSFEYVPSPKIPTGPRGFSHESSGPLNRSTASTPKRSDTATPKRPREEIGSPRHDYSSDRRKLTDNSQSKSAVRGLKNLPSGPRSNRFGRDSFVPVGGVKSFTRPTEVMKSRSKLGFNDDASDEEEIVKKDVKVHTKKSKLYLQVTNRKTPPYERILQIGEGTYGKVYKAKNNITGRLVALKRLRLEGEKEGFPITAMREISLLQSFQNENISGLLEIMTESNMIYMIFDYLEHDLTALLQHPAVDMTEANIKDVFKQLLFGISYLHDKRIMHRDIKGSNILVDKNGIVKITDFGLARKMKNHKVEESPQYTNRVITLWSRPPELLMGSTDYGREVDMWGFGCLLLELFTKKPAFRGNNEVTQLEKIFQIMGTPTYADWPEMDDLPWYHLIQPQPYRRVFNAIYDKLLKSENCIKLCEGLLNSNPAHRLSARQALDSEWFNVSPKPNRLNLEGLEELHEYEVKKRRKAKLETESERGSNRDQSVV